MDRNPELRRLIVESEVTREQVEDWKKKVWQAYLDLARDLPDGHVWKEGKLEHARHGMEEAREHAVLLGLEGIEVDIIGFLFFCHDVGRLVQGARAERKETQSTKLHGIYSVGVLMERLEIFYVTPFWQTMFAAIAWHAVAEIPTSEELYGNRSVLALTTLLRDMDKREGFLKAQQYTQDQEHKRKQMEANWKEQRRKDPTWGEEKGSIEPAELVDQFCRHLPINRDKCQSYEAYMLQYLAWIFDVVNPEILQLIIDERGPHIVLSYLADQILESSPEQWNQIFQTMSFLWDIQAGMK